MNIRWTSWNKDIANSDVHESRSRDTDSVVAEASNGPRTRLRCRTQCCRGRDTVDEGVVLRYSGEAESRNDDDSDEDWLSLLESAAMQERTVTSRTIRWPL